MESEHCKRSLPDVGSRSLFGLGTEKEPMKGTASERTRFPELGRRFNSLRLTPGFLVLFAFWIGSPQNALAQTIFLPTWQQFSVRSTVVIPDRGAASLGGSSSRRTARTTRGLPGGPHVGSNRGARHGASSASVHVTIIDWGAWDAAVRSRAASRRWASELAQARASHARSAARDPTDHAGQMSLAEIRRLRARKRSVASSTKR